MVWRSLAILHAILIDYLFAGTSAGVLNREWEDLAGCQGSHLPEHWKQTHKILSASFDGGDEGLIPHPMLSCPCCTPIPCLQKDIAMQYMMMFIVIVLYNSFFGLRMSQVVSQVVSLSRIACQGGGVVIVHDAATLSLFDH
jgi:hypothetical protein